MSGLSRAINLQIGIIITAIILHVSTQFTYAKIGAQSKALFTKITVLCVFSLSVLTDSATMDYMQLARLLCPWGFSRQEYWSGEPIPSPGDLPDPGIESRSPALQVNSLPAELPGKPNQ